MRVEIEIVSKDWKKDAAPPADRGHRAKIAEAMRLMATRIQNGSDEANVNFDGVQGTLEICEQER